MTVEEAKERFNLNDEQAEVLRKWEDKMDELNPVYVITDSTVKRLLDGDKRMWDE